jgi:prepilin-type N-terminal cleavage/methylation domain-containing protein
MKRSFLSKGTTALGKKQKGFTLIELLVVIGILAILLAIVLVAINPGRQFEQANDTKRSSDVNAILNAIHQYAADNQGNLPFTIEPGTETAVSHTALGAEFCSHLVPTYMAALPVDPARNQEPIEPEDCILEGWNTGYFVERSATDGRITVSIGDIRVIR